MQGRREGWSGWLREGEKEGEEGRVGGREGCLLTVLQSGEIVHGVNEFDVGARNEVVGLGGDKDGGLDVRVIGDLLL